MRLGSTVSDMPSSARPPRFSLQHAAAIKRETDKSLSSAYPALEADEHITTHGSDWYFAVTAVMTVATFAFIGLSLRQPRQKRVFHYITAAITMVASIAYFTMGSNLGWTAINVEFERSDPVVRGQDREIFYVRYIGKSFSSNTSNGLESRN